MFTGLIEDIGSVAMVRERNANLLLTIRTSLPTSEIRIGDSVNIDGYCQTVIDVETSAFSVEVSPETQAVTTASRLRTGDKVNLERAMRLADRLGGHFVLGHVDGVGKVTEVQKQNAFTVIKINAPSEVLRYCIPKGSVAVNGVSLTINDVFKDGFAVGIIPHTLSATTLGNRKTGDAVNLEADLIGKYVERFLSEKKRDKKESGAVNLDLLAKTGFLD